uniref:Uncharacterized protein n=1 Tax=Conchiformibius kuhniae TaxID=211502 RepID=A0A8T9MVK7_9NEIS|nr:hypothetical protein LVJ77_03600 [Conchiformibius kuhniae]
MVFSGKLSAQNSEKYRRNGKFSKIIAAPPQPFATKNRAADTVPRPRLSARQPIL